MNMIAEPTPKSISGRTIINPRRPISSPPPEATVSFARLSGLAYSNMRLVLFVKLIIW